MTELLELLKHIKETLDRASNDPALVPVRVRREQE